MARRKSGKDLRKEYQDLLDKTMALEARIKDRVEMLMKNHPKAMIGEITTAEDYLKSFKIDDLEIENCLNIIERIEQHIADKHPHKQTKIFLVPEKPVGERVLINGKTGEAFTRNSNE